MPLFVYACETCSHRWEELFIKSTDMPPEACPDCKAPTPRRCSTTATSRFQAADGVGGWEMNTKGTLQRVVNGKNSVRYGD